MLWIPTQRRFLLENQNNLARALMENFGVDGIPSMVAINGKGETIRENDDSFDFRSLIAAHGADAFPLTP
jgi:hypothetical protein